ncbi:MAG: peroxiredoxin [Dehalococcoidia bacterium]
MTVPAVGDQAPDFALQGTDGAVRLSAALTDGPVVLAFYQEDDTPGCRTQLTAFRDDYDLVRDLGARVLAVSTDTLDSHRVFADRLGPPFPLLADSDGAVARLYGVYDEAERRARRAVFVIGTDGTVRLSIPWYTPGNPSQFEQVFRALGLEG